jgi:glycosyltransferase involved in cell wall biosynthesis
MSYITKSKFLSRLKSPKSLDMNIVTPEQVMPAAAKVYDATISVVIPLYNHEAYIESALESVLSQSSPANEIILIDDGSSDGGFEIGKRVLEGVPNAKVFRQVNAGAHNALNRAIGVSRCDYIAVLNSDDVFKPDKLARCREVLSKGPNLGLIAGEMGVMDGHGSRLHSGLTIDWLSRAQKYLDEFGLVQLSLLNENFIGTTSNMVFSRRLWKAAGGFQPLRYCHDLDFLMFAFSHGEVFLDHKYEHIIYRVHERNTIKEDFVKVRIEIAAVISKTLEMSGTLLFSPNLDACDYSAFKSFLTNKNISDLVLYFQAISRAFPHRSAFYEYVTKQDCYKNIA